MNSLAGTLLIIVGVFEGLYVGLWLMFIGGIVALIEIWQSGNVEAINVALNIVRVIFAGFVGYVSGMALIFPGYTILIK